MITSSARMSEVRMKEEGEITDDDDDDEKQLAEVAEMAVTDKEPPRLNLYNRKRKHAVDLERRTVSISNHRQRSRDSMKSRDHVEADSRNTAVPALMELPVCPAKSSKLDFKANPVTCAPVPSLMSNCPRYRPPLLPRPSLPSLQISSCPQPRPLFPPQSRVAETIRSDCELQESSWLGLDCQKSHSSNSCEITVSDSKEIITIDDSDVDESDNDCEVIESELNQDEMTPEDEDLDELQLRRDALDSAVKCNKSKNTECNEFGGDSAGLLDCAGLKSDHIHLRYTSTVSSLPAKHCDNDSIQSSVAANLRTSDSAGICGVSAPISAIGCEAAHNQLACHSVYSSEYCIEPPGASHPRVVPNTEQHTSALTDSTEVSSAAERSLTLPVCQDVQQLGIDNYDEVEMDLDSGTDSECPEVISGERTRSTLNIADQNIAENHSTDSLLEATDTYYSEPKLKPLYSSHGSVISPASLSDGRDSSQMSEGRVVDGKKPKLETVDASNSNNVQQQRKVKDADKKSELLLRAAVLQSLSSKRQQQQQQQTRLDTLSDVVARHRDKSAKLQVTSHSTKSTTTSSAGNQLTVQLPVHQPVVISFSGDSSDSDDEGQVVTVDSGTAASNSLLGVGSAVDRFLREIRRATEAPESKGCDTVPSCQVDTTTSATKCQEKSSSSVPDLEKHHTLSNSSSNLLPLSTSNKTPLMKTPVASNNKGIGDSTQSDVRDNSLQKITLSDLQKKLRQQKTDLSKTKLKIARKKEQVDAAEERIKKLREQLVAAERIAITGKKQLSNLHEESVTLSRGIERCQEAVRRLEVGLHIAQNNPVSSANVGSHNLEMSSVNSQSSAAEASCTWSSNTSSCRVSSAANEETNSVRCIIKTDVSGRRLISSEASQSSHNTQQPQLHDSELMTSETKMSDWVKPLRHLNSVGDDNSGTDVPLIKDVKKEVKSEAECNEFEYSQTTAQQSVNVALPYVAGERSVSQSMDVGLCTEVKPCISDIKSSDVLTVPKTEQTTSNDDLAVASDSTAAGHFSSASSFSLPSDKKMKEILQQYKSDLVQNSSMCSVAPSCPLFVSDPMLVFQIHVNSTSSVPASYLATGSKSDAFETGASYSPYCSSLLCFRSYRFSDFYRQQGLNVSTETFSHKLDCNLPLCQFDLMGKCLDKACHWQHQSDYSLSKKEQQVDIVSYCPTVVGIDSSIHISKYEQLMNQYVEKFLHETFAELSYSEQCLRLIDRVKTAAGLRYPSAVCTTARNWKLQGSKQRFSTSDKNEYVISAYNVSAIRIHESVAAGCLASGDVRYWMLAENDQIRNLEAAVKDCPGDDDLWIKLAYAKMMEKKWSASHDECISYGLNVLTRAVEANPSNSKLWTHYLDLYMLRSHDAEIDVSSLYEQAIQYAPSYEFFWRYLQLPGSYSQKIDICKRLRQYLCSPRCPDDADARSHHLLETVLCQSAFCTMSGRFKDGLRVFQSIVHSKASVIWLTLTCCDRIVMWLSFIHLYEYRQLPLTLFDPANSNPGPIVRKEAFVVPFQIGKKTRVSYKTLWQLFECASIACDKDTKKPGSDAVDDREYTAWLAALHRSRILLELSCRGSSAARQLSQQLLQRRPHLVDVWLFLIQLTVASRVSTVEGQTLSSTISNTFEEALACNPHSVALFLAGVCALIDCGDTEAALSFAERCPISLFEVDQLDTPSVDPNLLYCCLLGQPVPPNYKAPPQRSTVSRQYLAAEQANLWISYCLLLDLQGAHDQAAETYRLALGCLTATKDVQRLWLAFLRRTAAVILGQLKWLSSADRSDQKRRLWQQFGSDIEQALVSLSVRRSLPHSSQMCDDYSTHNQIIQLYVSCVSDPDRIQDAYEKYLRQMPANTELALACANYLLNRDALQLNLGICLMALHSSPRAELLWHMSLRLCHRTDNVGLMRSLYAKATEMLPFSVSLWKMYITFEVTNKSPGRALEAIEKCRRLQVNVSVGLIDFLMLRRHEDASFERSLSC